MKEQKQKKKKRLTFEDKRCPECFARLPLETDFCSACCQKVGDVNKYGLAKKPINWRGYSICLVSMLAFGIYIWWAFFKAR